MQNGDGKQFVIKKRIKDNNFEILKMSEIKDLNKFNFTAKQLKAMCKHYKLHLTGNKTVLKERIYNHFLLCKNIIKIQRYIKKYNLQTLINSKGPAFIKRHICVNDTDFYNMENLRDIAINQFFSYRDIDNKIYGFDLLSLSTLLKEKGAKNPYNRNSIPDYVESQIKQVIKLSPFYFSNVDTFIDNKIEDENKNLELRALSIFQSINSLGNYTDFKWFWGLRRHGLVKFLRELFDIWVYRAGLTEDIKLIICPTNGNPFMGSNITAISRLELSQIRKESLMIIEKFLSANEDSNKSLGANYVLCALTLVSQEAAENLPWLYQSVQQH